uniref:Uncharacterized protein n=1 Tax=Leersia perrieri TaxID=77586 RepID=A0A0D9VDM3_9ORYZ
MELAGVERRAAPVALPVIAIIGALPIWIWRFLGREEIEKVIFRAAHWLRFWAKLQKCED